MATQPDLVGKAWVFTKLELIDLIIERARQEGYSYACADPKSDMKGLNELYVAIVSKGQNSPHFNQALAEGEKPTQPTQPTQEPEQSKDWQKTYSQVQAEQEAKEAADETTVQDDQPAGSDGEELPEQPADPAGSDGEELPEKPAEPAKKTKTGAKAKAADTAGKTQGNGKSSTGDAEQGGGEPEKAQPPEITPESMTLENLISFVYKPISKGRPSKVMLAYKNAVGALSEFYKENPQATFQDWSLETKKQCLDLIKVCFDTSDAVLVSSDKFKMTEKKVGGKDSNVPVQTGNNNNDTGEKDKPKKQTANPANKGKAEKPKVQTMAKGSADADAAIDAFVEKANQLAVSDTATNHDLQALLLDAYKLVADPTIITQPMVGELNIYVVSDCDNAARDDNLTPQQVRQALAALLGKLVKAEKKDG